MQNYKEGYVYHIKDSYFEKAKDDKLMKNKENGTFRPTFYCLKDEKTSLLWVVPLSSRVEKYQKVADKQAERYGKSLGIYIGSFDGKSAAFLIQNMFPITEKYLDHIHTRNGNPVPVKKSIQEEVKSRMQKARRLVLRGNNVVFPDIRKLENLMLDELAEERNESVKNDILINSAPKNEHKPEKGEPLFSRSKIMSDDFKPTSEKSQEDKEKSKNKNSHIGL